MYNLRIDYRCEKCGHEGVFEFETSKEIEILEVGCSACQEVFISMARIQVNDERGYAHVGNEYLATEEGKKKIKKVLYGEPL